MFLILLLFSKMISIKRYTHRDQSQPFSRTVKGSRGQKHWARIQQAYPLLLFYVPFSIFIVKTLQSKYFPFSFLSSLFHELHRKHRQAWMGIRSSLICRKRETGSKRERNCPLHKREAGPSWRTRGRRHLTLATTTDPVDPASPSSVRPAVQRWPTSS